MSKAVTLSTNDQTVGRGQIRIIASKSCDCETYAKEGNCKHKIGGKRRPILEVTPWTKNLIMDGTYTGKQILLAILGNDPSYTGTGHITFAEVGTGSTAPAVSDVALTTSIARAPISQVLTSGDTKSFQFFFNDASLPNTTIREFGSFVDGSITTASGNLFNHALFGVAYTKSAGTDITVQFDYTLT